MFPRESVEAGHHFQDVVRSGQRVTSSESLDRQPAVWVWVTLAHEEVDAETRARLRDIVRASVRDQVRREAHWVYVRFSGLSESE